MSLFQIEPRDPLCFTDGRGTQGGALRTLQFPWPSTLAGLVRARIGSDREGRFTHRRPAELRRIGVRGPWLLRWPDQEGRAPDWFVPAPRDCVWLASSPTDPASPSRRLPLTPVDLPSGSRSSLRPGLQLVGLQGPPRADKPRTGAAFWSWAELERWLLQPASRDVPLTGATRGDFLGHLPVERRTHVAITPGGTTALDGALFETQGLRFAVPWQRAGEGRASLPEQRLGLGFACDEVDLEGASKLAHRLGPVVLGGERRVAFLGTLSGTLPPVPDALLALARSGHRRFRVVLLTPAVFEQGAVPDSLHGAPVMAAVVPRPEVISGWDFEARQPKPTRRVAAAGSVYWVELPASLDPLVWLQEVWMHPLSSQSLERPDGLSLAQDGFGLAVVGVAS